MGDFAEDIKDVIVWDKGSGQPSMHEKVLNSCFELILILENDKKRGRMIQGARFERGSMGNIIRVPRGRGIDKTHAASFPDKLVRTLIRAFSEKGDLIYDPFVGTGTTAVSAMETERRFIGSELQKEYCDIAEQRIRKAHLPLLIDHCEERGSREKDNHKK